MLDVGNSRDLEVSKRWLSSLLATVGKKAYWVVPRSGTTVEICQDSKTAYITYGTSDKSLEVVFEALGYECRILRCEQA